MNTESHDWTSAVIDASLLGQVDLVSQLLDDGVDINLKDHKGWTAMHFAAAAGCTCIVELLLTRGADVNSTTIKNESCLLLAVLSGHIDVVRVLVSAGADVNLQSKDGVSPLHAASYRKYYDVVKIMLDRVAQKHWCDITANEDSRPTPLLSRQQDPGGFVFAISPKRTNESSLLRYGLKVITILVRAFVTTAERGVSSYLHNVTISQYAMEFIRTLKEFLKDTQALQVYINENVYSVIPLFCTLFCMYREDDDETAAFINYRSFTRLLNDNIGRAHSVYTKIATAADVNLQSNDTCSPLDAW